jgi:hypothetical protein
MGGAVLENVFWERLFAIDYSALKLHAKEKYLLAWKQSMTIHFTATM